MSIWDFLRDEHNRAALTILGSLFAALLAGVWAVFREFRTTSRRLREVEAELERIKMSQADILRRYEWTRQRDDLLLGIMAGKIAPGRGPKRDDEPPTDDIE
jgi:hypothetical protein